MRTTTRPALPPRSLRRSGLLVSVRSLGEYRSLADTQVDWIDVKEPNHGSLGRPRLEDTLAIQHAVLSKPRDGLHFSVALGDLEQLSDQDFALYCKALGSETYIKVGLAGASAQGLWQTRLLALSKLLVHPHRLILVHYADAEIANSPTWDEVLHLGTTLECSHILVDTWRKDGRSLVDICSQELLRHMAAHAHAMGLELAMSGSLRLADIPILVECGASWIGLRTSLCLEESRTSQICPVRVAEALQILAHANQIHSSRTIAEDVIRK